MAEKLLATSYYYLAQIYDEDNFNNIIVQYYPKLNDLQREVAISLVKQLERSRDTATNIRNKISQYEFIFHNKELPVFSLEYYDSN